jgi:hypothetical protein
MLFNIFFRRRSARSSMPVIGFLETVPPSFGTHSPWWSRHVLCKWACWPAVEKSDNWHLLGWLVRLGGHRLRIDAGLQAHKQARGIARGAEPHPFLTEITIDTASLAGKVSFKASSSRWSSARFEFESSADGLEIWTSGFFREMPRFANIAVGSSLIVFILSSARLS